MSRVLVTGARGYVGRHAVTALLRRGHEVVGVRSADPAAPEQERPGLRWVTADLLEPAGPEHAVAEADADALLHLAWYAEHGKFWTAVENIAWSGATLELLRGFAAAGGRRVVCAGTCAEYDWSALDGPCVEGVTPLRPATLYGAAKHGTHVVAESLAAQTGLSLAWGRIFFSFGPGEPPGRLVPSVVRALLAGEEAHVTEGHQIRDFLPVEQLADAFAAVLESDFTGPVNIASGEGIALRDLIALIAETIGRPDLVRYGAVPTREGEPAVLVADVGRLRREVGWAACRSVLEGIRHVVRVPW